MEEKTIKNLQKDIEDTEKVIGKLKFPEAKMRRAFSKTGIPYSVYCSYLTMKKENKTSLVFDDEYEINERFEILRVLNEYNINDFIYRPCFSYGISDFSDFFRAYGFNILSIINEFESGNANHVYTGRNSFHFFRSN